MRKCHAAVHAGPLAQDLLSLVEDYRVSARSTFLHTAIRLDMRKGRTGSRVSMNALPTLWTEFAAPSNYVVRVGTFRRNVRTAFPLPETGPNRWVMTFI